MEVRFALKRLSLTLATGMANMQTVAEPNTVTSDQSQSPESDAATAPRRYKDTMRLQVSTVCARAATYPHNGVDVRLAVDRVTFGRVHPSDDHNNDDDEHVPFEFVIAPSVDFELNNDKQTDEDDGKTLC